MRSVCVMRSQKPVASGQKDGKSAPHVRAHFFWILMRRSCSLSLLLLIPLSLLSGCATPAPVRQADHAVADYFVGDYPDAERLLEPLATKTDENFVLNNCRLGSTALVQYDLRTSEDAFLRAYEVINSVGVNDGGRSLGAAIVDEKLKIWKGEPYERAMANFYLGLVYYMQHDYNNARAAFENALFKLRDYGEGSDKDDAYRRVESNFALGYLMLAKSWQRLGEQEKAQKNFDRVVELQSYLAPIADPRVNGESNVLLIVDFGHGPKKITNGDGTLVGLGPTPAEVGPIPPPVVVVDGQRLSLGGLQRPPVDLLALAQDRRWQDIDTIRAVKSGLGTGLIAGGAIASSLSRNRDTQLYGLAAIGAGLLLKATSQADVRQWEMLPRSTFVLPLRLTPGPHDITVDFPNLPAARQTWHGLVAPEQGEATYYYRIQRYTPGPYTWPPPALQQGKMQNAE